MRPPVSPLETASALRAWLQGAEAAQAAARGRRSAETEAALRARLAELDAALKALGAVGDSLEAAKALGRGARGAGRKLKEDCEGIAGERDSAAALARELAKRLRGHDDLTAAAAEVAQAESAPESAPPEGTLAGLRALGECEAWAQDNPGHTGAARYTARLRSLAGRALAVSRKRCEHLLASAEKSAGSQPPDSSPGAAAGGASISQWQAVLGAGGWRELCTGLEELSNAPSAACSDGNLPSSGPGTAAGLAGISRETSASVSLSALSRKCLEDLEELYGQTRAQRIFPGLQEAMQEAVESRCLSEAATKCFELAESALSREEAAALGLFPSKASAESAVRNAAGPVGGAIFDCLRPYYIMEGRVDSLADLADAIGEIQALYGRDSDARGSGAARGLGEVALEPLVASVLADVRQRLVYRAQAFVRDDIALFTPTDDEVAYPEVLEDGAQAESGPLMYLPLSQTLFVLKRLYTAVDRRTFGGIAQEAIKVCSDQLHIAAGLIVKRSSVLDGHLFLVRNLLTLRESLAQYSEADFSVVENELDFTHMRDHMGRIMRGEASVFQLGSSNAVLMLATDGRPRVNRMQSDARRELERNLKAACEAFILAVTKATVEPMLGFITKVTAVAVSGSVQPLKEHAFAALPRVAAIVEKVNEAVGDVLPKASAKLTLYVPKPGFKEVLFGPIKSNIVEAHAQLAALLEREYPDEDRSVVQLKDIAELRQLLDSLK